jgi:hypothetical protein
MLPQSIMLFALAAVPAPAPADAGTLVGTWVATAEWRGRQAVFVLELGKGGKARRTITVKGELGDSVEGTFQAAKDMLSLDFPADGDDHRTTALVREHTAESLVLTTFQSRTGMDKSAELKFKRRH